MCGQATGCALPFPQTMDGAYSRLAYPTRFAHACRIASVGDKSCSPQLAVASLARHQAAQLPCRVTQGRTDTVPQVPKLGLKKKGGVWFLHTAVWSSHEGSATLCLQIPPGTLLLSSPDAGWSITHWTHSLPRRLEARPLQLKKSCRLLIPLATVPLFEAPARLSRPRTTRQRGWVRAGLARLLTNRPPSHAPPTHACRGVVWELL